MFPDLTANEDSCHTASGEQLAIIGKRNIDLAFGDTLLKLSDALYVPCLTVNLILFIVHAGLALRRDFHLAAERAELSDFEFYCIFERIGARAEWSQARHLGHVTLGCVRWLLETRVLRGLQGRRSAPLGRGTSGEPCHWGVLSSQVAWPGWHSFPSLTFAGGTIYCLDLWGVR